MTRVEQKKDGKKCGKKDTTTTETEEETDGGAHEQDTAVMQQRHSVSYCSLVLGPVTVNESG